MVRSAWQKNCGLRIDTCQRLYGHSLNKIRIFDHQFEGTVHQCLQTQTPEAGGIRLAPGSDFAKGLIGLKNFVQGV